ncbi:transcriptional regulator (plasmid) [Azospirillum sp. B510]|uniref:LysR family transcriptional regulator n=1 Tax=Azospirillum sp. (strain B510) TaxID=137722 RepID=UPI0001C4C9AD|nr:LysR family transcriptional regulator [Azospirillum sp. B510]BAI74695.1 transcriptional regulator [Azospirillum sp. B510]
MELRVLRSFVTLAEELHFGRASERLGIVQPALSMQIKALEQELGVQLFIRDRHRVELSPSGQLFLSGARATLDQAQRAVQQVQASERGEIGRLRIGFISSVLPWYMPALLRRLHALYPRIELDLKDMPTPDQIRGLREKRIDFGFLRLPIDEKAVECREVLSESFIVAFPQEHPLTRLAEIAPADLSGQPCFLLARRFAPGFCDELMLALTRQGLIPNIERELGEFTTMLALVGAGMGIGILPKLAMPSCPPGVAVRPLRLPGTLSRVGLAWSDLTPALNRTFHREALAVAAEGQGG